MLGEEQIARYSRQIILPQVGGKGQQQLLSAAVALIGSGEMATTAGFYLAAAGVGALTLAGASGGAGKDLEALNADCHVVEAAIPADASGADALARRHDLIIAADITTELALRLNAACVACCRPLVLGRAEGSVAWMSVVAGPAEAACFACLQRRWPVSPLLPDASNASPVIRRGAAAFIGTLQVTAVIKQILGLEAATVARLVTYDALRVTVSETRVDKDPDCLICGTVADNQPRP